MKFTESVHYWTGWVGFLADKPDLNASHNDGYGQVYRTRAEARKRYQDVRRVSLREFHPKDSCHE